MKIPTSWAYLVAFASQLPSLARAVPNCPLAGAEFPPPQTLSLHPVWQQALARLKNRFDLIDAGSTFKTDGSLDELSYSIQIFSSNPGGGILTERHRTAPNLLANTTGVKQVDKDTVYRLGSVSKVYAVVAWLAELGDVHWNQPITNFIPELANISAQARGKPFDGVRQTKWEDITIAALASQVGGVGRDYGVIGEILQTPDIPPFLETIFPKLKPEEKPPCGAFPVCTREQFFQGLQIMVPSYPPWQTAAYSNIGFQLFTYALENITGKAFPDILQDRIIKPLGLTNTYYNIAPASIGIVPTDVQDSYWYVNLGDADPGGNMYSSPTDLSLFSRALLLSSLLPAHITRRWLQPSSFASDPAASVGAPWGIRRIQLDPTSSPFRSVSVFTKAGTFRRYSAFTTLIKEFGLGFTIMLAGRGKLSNFAIADMLGSELLPAYDAASRNEADLLFSGTYVSDPASGLNSTMIISTDPKKPGLGVTSWLHNATDMISFSIALQSGSSSPPLHPEIRLYYTQLEDEIPPPTPPPPSSSPSSSPTNDPLNDYSGPLAAIFTNGKKQAWKAVFEDTGLPNTGLGLFSTQCGAWVGLTGVTYASQPLDEFVFEFNAAGQVLSVVNAALRIRLWKVYPGVGSEWA